MLSKRVEALEHRDTGILIVSTCPICGSQIVRETGPCPVHREAPPPSLQDITIKRSYGAEARP
jgi:hypothetical protein